MCFGAVVKGEEDKISGIVGQHWHRIMTNSGHYAIKNQEISGDKDNYRTGMRFQDSFYSDACSRYQGSPGNYSTDPKLRWQRQL